jgi:hypothetical protein
VRPRLRSANDYRLTVASFVRAGHYRRATAVAMGFIATNSGGILSTWLFPAAEAPNYRRGTSLSPSLRSSLEVQADATPPLCIGTIVNLSLCIVTGVFGALNLVYLIHANKKKELRKATEAPDAATWHVEGDRHPSYK